MRPGWNPKHPVASRRTRSRPARARLGAQIFGPLFNAGANERRVDIEMARTEQLLNTYEQTFLTAPREVEDALVAAETLQLRLTSLVQLYQALGGGWVAARDILLTGVSDPAGDQKQD